MQRRTRSILSSLAAVLLAVVTALFVNRASAQEPLARLMAPRPQRAHAVPLPPKVEPNGPAHAEQAETHDAHAEHDENAPPPPINWYHGLLGAKKGAEPSLLWRTPDDPPPFLGAVLNFALLVFILVHFGRKPLAAALARRKESIMREIDDAQKLWAAAETRLKQYESRLERIAEEFERLRRESIEQGEREKARIIREAHERRERMRKDAELLLAQEIEQMRRALLQETVDEATRIASELLTQRMTLADHERFMESFFAGLRSTRSRTAPQGATPGGTPKGRWS